MIRKTLPVLTFNDDLADFQSLFWLWSEVNDDCLDVTFDFSYCRFLRQNAVAFLGGLARLIEDRGGRVVFLWNTLDPKIFTNLAQQGFLSAFGHSGGPWRGNSIPFRHDLLLDQAELMHYLKVLWLGRGWVNVSRPLQDAIVGQMWEIYANAFEHGESPIGVFSCGQYYPMLKKLKLSVVDFGVGIPSNVRRFCQTGELRADYALRWAFQPNTTTKPNGIGRGNGLDLLKRFVRVNNGHMQVFSHDGMAIIEKNGENYQVQQPSFEGTMVNISLECDDRYYCLESETSKEPLF